MNGEVQQVALRPDQSLINSQFDGYKLSLDSLPLKELPLKFKVNNPSPSQDQLSLQHMRIFSDADPLYHDPYSTDDNHIFLIIDDEGNIQKTIFDGHSRQWVTPIVVANLVLSREEGTFPANIIFLDKQTIIVSNGIDKITFYSTDEGRETWKVVNEFNPFKDDTHGFFLDDVRHVGSQTHLLLGRVFEKQGDGEKKVHNSLMWIVLCSDSWQEEHRQVIDTQGPYSFAILDGKCEHVVLMADKPPVVVEDSFGLKKVAEANAETDDQETTEDAIEEEAKHIYIWTQTSEEVHIVFQLEDAISKGDVKFHITKNTILLIIKDVMLLSGSLGGAIDSDSSTWTLSDKHQLEITLFKPKPIQWSEVVADDKRGKYVEDPEEKEKAADLLQKFTSSHAALGALGTSENFNSDQLEDCDMTEDEILSVFWLSKESQKVVKQCDVTGNQLLFLHRSFPNESPRVCIRHDVDGLLWSLDGEQPVHQITFAALGYVQASKSRRRWTDCSPDFSYAIIAELTNHVFIYWQPDEISTDLRNRKTCRQVSKVARQQLISLKQQKSGVDMGDSPNNDQILSVYAANETLFILSSDSLYAVCLK